MHCSEAPSIDRCVLSCIHAYLMLFESYLQDISCVHKARTILLLMLNVLYWLDGSSVGRE